MIAQDISLNENDDAVIKNGDFDLTDSDNVHIEHILIANKGHYFEYPLLGVGLINEIHGSTQKQRLKQTIRRQLTLDNYSVSAINIGDDFNITIDAKRQI